MGEVQAEERKRLRVREFDSCRVGGKSGVTLFSLRRIGRCYNAANRERKW